MKQTAENLLREAVLQIEYLHEKFRETGTGNALIEIINNYLAAQEAGPVAAMPEQVAAIALLKEYEQWEADLIGDNAMWWPYVNKDRISGKTYDKMLELQAKRNELLQANPQSGAIAVLPEDWREKAKAASQGIASVSYPMEPLNQLVFQHGFTRCAEWMAELILNTPKNNTGAVNFNDLPKND